MSVRNSKMESSRKRLEGLMSNQSHSSVAHLVGELDEEKGKEKEKQEELGFRWNLFEKKSAYFSCFSSF